ncbi:MAG: DUF1573 domain-containing protein [Planctomycetales bacterium]|nr:DUF1573 domain-containing protein [Planctomycetales bacterium]
MNKIFMTALFAILLGGATGFGISSYENSLEEFIDAKPVVLGSSENAPEVVSLDASKRPSARVVGSDTYDFGSMSITETRDHTFQVRNIGDADLTITFDAKSCQCTKVNLDKTVVPPGDVVNIYLQWKPKKLDLDFRQAATFRTNDPARPEVQLAIRGMVRKTARVSPDSVEFASMPATAGKTVDLSVFGYREEDFAVTSAELLYVDDPEFASHFSVEVLPMSTDDIENEVGAVAGGIVRVEVKPGLPVGPFAQSVRINTNKPDVEPFDITIHGTIISDIRVMAQPSIFSSELNSFLLGHLSGDKDHEFDFSLLIKGMAADEISMSAKSIDPDGILSIEFGTPKRLGKVARVPAKLTIKPTDKPVNRAGSQLGKAGEIVIDTSHPTVPELTLRVTFSIEASTAN